jgi:uncharacterized membrane protein YcaP (DUF421 family)
MGELFRLSVDPIELIVRGSLMYWFLFLLFRLVLRRDVGSIAIADVLLLVLIADASQNAMSGGYESITDGCILVATIAGWNYGLDWVSYRWRFVRNLIEPKPLMLVKDGRPHRRAMRREMVTMDELMAKLREHGYEHLAQVKAARMESDGEITVLGYEPPKPPEAAPAKSAGAPGAGAS